jgi:hypothetical protein
MSVPEGFAANSVDVAVLERLERTYGQALPLRGRDRELAGLMLTVAGTAVIVACGDARFVVIHGDGTEELHDIKAPIR